MRKKQKRNFNKGHKTQELKPLAPGDSVWIPGMQVEGTVEKGVAPRSYQVSTTPRGSCVGDINIYGLSSVHTLPPTRQLGWSTQETS